MPVAVVADAHLGGQGGEAVELVEQLGSLSPRNCERLVLLGDLFQAWVGSRRFETPVIAEVTGVLAELRTRGLPVHYIEGNRDFFITGGPYEELFESVGSELEFRTGGKRVLAVHGDGINRADRSYLFWRRVSKNAAVRLATRALPRAVAKVLLDGFERRLSETNFEHKRRIPTEVIAEYAAARLRQGFDVVLLGHFHEPFRRRLDGGEVVVLDAWFRSRRVEWIEEAVIGARP